MKEPSGSPPFVDAVETTCDIVCIQVPFLSSRSPSPLSFPPFPPLSQSQGTHNLVAIWQRRKEGSDVAGDVSTFSPTHPSFPSSTQPTLHRPPSKAVTAVNRSAAQKEKQGSGRGFAEEHSRHDCRLTLFLGEPAPSPSLPCNLISRSSSLLWRPKAPSSSPPSFSSSSSLQPKLVFSRPSLIYSLFSFLWCPDFFVSFPDAVLSASLAAASL